MKKMAKMFVKAMADVAHKSIKRPTMKTAYQPKTPAALRKNKQ